MRAFLNGSNQDVQLGEPGAQGTYSDRTKSSSPCELQSQRVPYRYSQRQADVTLANALSPIPNDQMHAKPPKITVNASYSNKSSTVVVPTAAIAGTSSTNIEQVRVKVVEYQDEKGIRSL